VEASVLRPLIPRELDIDLHDGTAYVGLVAFGMEGVRSRFWPESLSFRFLETNVRTYVHRGGRDPGVYFFSLDASSWLAARTARMGWGLPYYYATMRRERNGDRVTYSVDRRDGKRVRLRVEWEVGDALGPTKPGSLEHFLVERYTLHVVRFGTLLMGEVHHPPYPLQRARVLAIEDELVRAAGIAVSGPPPIVHCAQGVDVKVGGLRRGVAGLRAERLSLAQNEGDPRAATGETLLRRSPL
jgi:uncharacterized protein YqjF (DUF2071 family)